MSDAAKATRAELVRQSFGHVLRKHRWRLQLSQEKLAELAGFHPSLIGLYERGQRQPTLDSIFAIADGFEIKPGVLVEQCAARMEAISKRSPAGEDS